MRGQELGRRAARGGGPTTGRLRRGARGLGGEAAAWTWAQAADCWLVVRSLTHHLTRGPDRPVRLKSPWLLLETTGEAPQGRAGGSQTLLAPRSSGTAAPAKTLGGFKAQAPRFPEFVVWRVPVFPWFN